MERTLVQPHGKRCDSIQISLIPLKHKQQELISMLGHYKHLISIRHAISDLSNGSIASYSIREGLLAYTRGDSLLIVHNLTSKEQFFTLYQEFQFFMHFPSYIRLPEQGRIAPYSTMICKRKGS